MMDDRDVFLKAIDVLQERGWTRWTNEDDEGRVCLLGAVQVALGGPADYEFCQDESPEVWTRALALSNAVARREGFGGRLCFNDHPARTVEDVIFALKRAAHGEAA